MVSVAVVGAASRGRGLHENDLTTPFAVTIVADAIVADAIVGGGIANSGVNDLTSDNVDDAVLRPVACASGARARHTTRISADEREAVDLLNVHACAVSISNWTC
jgi:hypothetical protein